jgi:uncharacterized cupin superfamily protein
MTDVAVTESYTNSVNNDEWKTPFVHEGVEYGSMNVIHVTEDESFISGFWRIVGDDNGNLKGYVPHGWKTVNTIEGRMKVTVHGGDVTELGPGDAITIPAGAVTDWECLERPYREIFVIG